MKNRVRGRAETPSSTLGERAPAGSRVGRHSTAVARFRAASMGWFGLILALGVVALGCGGNQGPAVGTFQSSSQDSIFITVENQNFYDAAVFLQFQGGARRRLATVQAYTTNEFSVRYDPSELWFHVDFIGARRETRSRGMSLSPGETVRLELTANAHRTGQLITRRQR